MSTIDSARLLQELRSLAAQAGAQAPAASKAVNGQPFGNMFSQALNTVNSLQQTAGDLQTRVEMGDKSVSLVQAMIASQKASVAFQATVQVRNKVVQAYQDIMNMPI